MTANLINPAKPVLVLAEHDNKKLSNNTLHALKVAQAFQADIEILIAGYQIEPLVQTLSTLEGVRKIHWADASCYQHGLAENVAALLADFGKNYQAIVAAASSSSKNILPRAAALLDVAMISEATAILSPDTFVRPIYAGNANATVQSSDPLKILTIRSHAFPRVNFRENTSEKAEKAELIRLNQIFDLKLSEFLQLQTGTQTRPELTQAKIVVSGGRGLQSKENFKFIEEIADKLHAAIGATRAAVDAGFVPNEYQVGQTGKLVAPDLYIAIGISGAIQHLAGMKDSKVIVAINKDKDAPIFQIADYGLVGDLFQILPEFNRALDALKKT